MLRTLLTTVACILSLALVAGAAEEQQPVTTASEATVVEAAPTPAGPDLMSLLGASTEDQRVRTFRFIRNRYPTLATDLIVLLQTRHPGIFVTIDRELQAHITANYPWLSVTVQRTLQDAINERYPQVRNEIADLIARDYPDLNREMGEGGSDDPAARIARLVRERHRALLEDVLCLLREQHPTLLQEVQREVLVKHPELMADVAVLIGERYPQLSREITDVLSERYPDLLPGILGILAPLPATDAPPVEE